MISIQECSPPTMVEMSFMDDRNLNDGLILENKSHVEESKTTANFGLCVFLKFQCRGGLIGNVKVV